MSSPCTQSICDEGIRRSAHCPFVFGIFTNNGSKSKPTSHGIFPLQVIVALLVTSVRSKSKPVLLVQGSLYQKTVIHLNMDMKGHITQLRQLFVQVDNIFDVTIDRFLPNRSLYSWIIISFYCSYYIFIVVSSVFLLWFYKSCSSGITPLHESVTGSLYKNNIRLSFVLAIPLFLDVLLDYLSLRWGDSREKNRSKQMVQCYTRFSLLALLLLPKLFLTFVNFGSYSAEAYIVLNAYKLAAINGAFMAYIAEIDAVSRSESMTDLNVGRTCLLVLFTCAPAHYVGLLWSILDNPFYSISGFSIVMFFYVLRLYGYYRGFFMLWKWWQRLQIRGTNNMTSSDISSTVYIGKNILPCSCSVVFVATTDAVSHKHNFIRPSLHF